MPIASEDAAALDGVPAEIIGGMALLSTYWPVALNGGPATLGRAKQFCATWGVPADADAALGPIAVAIPTLILSGQYDIGEPPAHGKAVAALLKDARVLQIPNAAHGQGFTYPLCAGSIAAAFVDAPASPIDAACLAKIPAIAWKLP